MSADGQGKAYQAVVKNTFLEAVAVNSQNDAMRRSASDGDLSRSSGEMKFWLPSLSSSQSSHLHSTSSDRKGALTQQQDMMTPGSGKQFQPSYQSSASSGGVALQAFGLPLLCNAENPSGVPAYADSWYAAAPATSNNVALASALPAGGSSLGSHAAYVSKEFGRPAPLPAAVSEYVSVAGLVQQIHRETGAEISELQSLYEQGILQNIPRNDEGQLSSVGSIAHQDGKCSPCLFWFRKTCSKSIVCNYCHFKHKGQRNKRIRPSRKTRMQMKGTDTQGSPVSDEGSDEDGCVGEQDATGAPKKGSTFLSL